MRLEFGSSGIGFFCGLSLGTGHQVMLTVRGRANKPSGWYPPAHLGVSVATGNIISGSEIPPWRKVLANFRWYSLKFVG